MRILLVEDHRLVRYAFQALLAAQPGLTVVGAAATGAEGVRLAQERSPDVLLVDLWLPDMPGTEVIRQVRQFLPQAAALALTASDREEDVVGALQAGAAGYVLKSATTDDLLAALRAAAAGECWIQPRAARRLADWLGRPAIQGQDPPFSAQEEAILDLLAAGCSNAEIARRLFLSPHTVRKYLAGLFRKLGVRNRTQAAALALARRQGRGDQRSPWSGSAPPRPER